MQGVDVEPSIAIRERNMCVIFPAIVRIPNYSVAHDFRQQRSRAPQAIHFFVQDIPRQNARFLEDGIELRLKELGRFSFDPRTGP